MRIKKTLVIGLSLTMVLGMLVGCGGASKDNTSNSPTSADTSGKDVNVKLTFSTPDPDSSSITIAAKHYAELIKEKSGGTVEVQVFANGSLYGGDTAAGVKQLGSGGMDILTLTSAAYASFNPEFTAISIPYLFSSGEEYRDYLNSENGTHLLDSTQDWGITSVGFWTRSFRQITNSVRPINSPEDLKGIKMRVLNNPLWVEFFGATGATTTPMSFGEVYTALQLNTIDGQENPVDIPLTSKFYEVQKYLTLSNHIVDAWVVGFNSKKLESLSANQQKAIQEATDEMQQWKWDYDITADAKAQEDLISEGMEINEITPENQARFVEISNGLSDKYKELVGNDDLFDKTMKFVGK